MEVEQMIQVLTQLGVAAVLGWYLYYDTTVVKPKINDQMLIRMDAITDRQAASVERICANFSASIKQERESCEVETRMLQDEIRHLRGLSESTRRLPGEDVA